MPGSYRIGVDIGGTFTDFTMVDDRTGDVFVEKCLTTPDRPERAVLEGMRRFKQLRADTLHNAEAVIHATTLLTNVVLERKGALTGLLTTAGFRDVLEFAREMRYDIYDPFIEFPEPLVERPLRIGVPERVLVDGRVHVPLDEAAVRAAAAVFRKAGVQSVAVCFLHSYRNPDHERRAREILAAELPGVEFSISSEVHPEPKEYERTSTTVVDAYVKPTAAQYLDRLSAELRADGYPNNLFVMLSNGGTATAETTKRFPVQAVESGPAAGVEAAAHYGRLIGARRLLSFDMGGTTAKLCVVLDGKAARTRTFEVDRVQRFKPGSGIPIATPVYDLLEIGAGGGSIARVNALGLMQVGPDSANSSPGPACYDLGGEHPTVTDCDLVLGFLDADSFLGGEMKLSAAAAERAVRNKLAEPLATSVVEAAWGVHNLVNETMASAARVHIAEKGQTARNLTLVGFGGAGPVHAIGLARKLGCPQVVIPPLPGVMSAFGLLTAPMAIERPRAVRRLLRDVDLAELDRWTHALETEAAALLPAGGTLNYACMADIWRVGQDYPLEIEVVGRWSDAGARQRIEDAFNREYAEHYGRVDDDTPLEVVTLRVKAWQASAKPVVKPGAAGADPQPKAQRRLYVPSAGGYQQAPVYARKDLGPGSRIAGPAIIEERESTTVIDRGDTLTVDEFGCLVVTLASQEAQ
ncbi:MAG: hydantoinase/oxoprolinase family protein [Betaproteobacteria bacterium]|nr:hydantoinase/oxoprolinase family protein [Betaproteobacteria bacterium]